MNAAPLRFLLVGLSNTFVGLSTIYLASRFGGLNDWLSNALGYVVGFIWSFAINRRWTFKAQGSVSGHLRRYLLVFVVAYAANLAVLLIARSILGSETFASQICGMATYTVIAYLGSRHFVFAHR